MENVSDNKARPLEMEEESLTLSFFLHFGFFFFFFNVTDFSLYTDVFYSHMLCSSTVISVYIYIIWHRVDFKNKYIT